MFPLDEHIQRHITAMQGTVLINLLSENKDETSDLNNLPVVGMIRAASTISEKYLKDTFAFKNMMKKLSGRSLAGI